MIRRSCSYDRGQYSVKVHHSRSGSNRFNSTFILANQILVMQALSNNALRILKQRYFRRNERAKYRIA